MDPATIAAILSALGGSGMQVFGQYMSGMHGADVGKLGKEAAAGYKIMSMPAYKAYLRALKGEWDPTMLAAMTGRLEDVRGQSSAVNQAYMSALAARGMAGGPTMAAMRKLGEVEAGQEARAWNEMEMANYLQALQGIQQIAATTASLWAGGGVTPQANYAGAMQAGGSLLDNLALLLSSGILKGDKQPQSMYSNPYGWGMAQSNPNYYPDWM